MRVFSIFGRLKKKWSREVARRSILRRLETGRYTSVATACPICEQDSRLRIAEKDRYGLPAQLWLCQTCGMVYQHPRLDETSLKKFYATDYRRLYRGTNKLSADYVDRGRNRGKNIQAFLTGNGFSIGSQVLEMGCGPGGILQFFAERGHTVLGTEWDTHCVEAGKQIGVPILFGGLEELRQGRQRFDLIILNHMVEHLEDPVAYLKSLRDLLNPAGILYIEVPGLRDPERKESFESTIQLAHLSYFDACTLSLLLQKAGYTVCCIDEICRTVARPTAPSTALLGSDANVNANRALFHDQVRAYADL